MGVANAMIIQELQRTVKSADDSFNDKEETEKNTLPVEKRAGDCI